MVSKVSEKVMTQPLPSILDDIVDLIQKAEQATTEAKEAAIAARLAGEKAAGEAARVADAKIAGMAKGLSQDISDLATRLSQIETEQTFQSKRITEVVKSLGEVSDAVDDLRLWIKGELAVIWERVDAIDRKATKLNDGVVAAVDAFNKEITRP